MKSWQEESRSLWTGLLDVFGEPFGLRWFLPVPLLKSSPSYYEWRSTDDPDAYDERDPVVRRHFQKLQKQVEAAKSQLEAQGQGEGLRKRA